MSPIIAPTHPPPPAQLRQAAAAERIAELLIEVGLLLALTSYPQGCLWRPP